MVTFSAISKKRCIFFAIGPISKILDVLKSWDTILSRSYVDLCGRFQESSAKSWKSSVETVFQYSRCGAIGKWSSFFVIGPISKNLDVLKSWDTKLSSSYVDLCGRFRERSAKFRNQVSHRGFFTQCHLGSSSRYPVLICYLLCCVSHCGHTLFSIHMLALSKRVFNSLRTASSCFFGFLIFPKKSFLIHVLITAWTN